MTSPGGLGEEEGGEKEEDKEEPDFLAAARNDFTEEKASRLCCSGSVAKSIGGIPE